MSAGITTEDRTRGILNPAAGLKRFELRRHAPLPTSPGSSIGTGSLAGLSTLPSSKRSCRTRA